MNRYEFGHHLKNARKHEFRKAMKEMAAVIGISESQLRNYERGTVVKPSQETMAKLARIYKTPYQQVQDIYYPDEIQIGKVQKKLDSALETIHNDKSLIAKGVSPSHIRIARSSGSPEVKKLIIKMYELITGNKLL
jgi:transcriptional regulator with XRE-family HTH domain